MPRFRAFKFVRILLFIVLGTAVFGELIMHLWNWLMPSLFGLKPVTFLQGLGLLVLGKLLFGGFHRHGGGGWRRGNREGWEARKARWEAMTPEERERFRSGMRGRWGCRPQQQPAQPETQTSAV